MNHILIVKWSYLYIKANIYLPCKSFYCVIYWQDMYSFAILYIWTCLDTEMVKGIKSSKAESQIDFKTLFASVSTIMLHNTQHIRFFLKALKNHKLTFFIKQQQQQQQQQQHCLFKTYLTTSPSLTRRLFLTHLLILILSSVTVSSDSTMHTVSFLRLPFSNTVSPLNSWSSSIFFCERNRKIQLMKYVFVKT